MRIDTGSCVHQTELGVLPIDWKIRTIRELQFDISDGNYSSKYPRADEFKSIGVPFIRANNIKGLTITDDDMRFISEAKHSEITKGHLKDGDVLITNRGEIGNLAIVPTRHIGSNINAQIVRINTSGSEVSNRYFAYYLQKDEVKKILDDLSSGSALKQLPVNRLTTLKVIIPSPQEQTAIANALSDVDALIQELEKLIAKKQAIKTATMQQLLNGRTRLPQFAHHPDGRKKGYKPSELGEIPEDWEVVRLGDVGETIIGLTYSPSDVAEFGTLVLRSSNVQQGKLAYSDCVYVDLPLPDRVIVREGDILVCVRNGSRQLIGKCALIDKKAEGHAFGAFMSIYRTQHSKFVFYQFQSDLIQSQINEMMGATINQITNKDMASFLIGLPCDTQEQSAIAQICSDIDEEIQALEQRLNKTRHIKQGMMQELLTGKTRLVKPAEPA